MMKRAFFAAAIALCASSAHADTNLLVNGDFMGGTYLAVGEALKELEAEWIKAGFPTDRASLDRLIEEAVRKRHARLEGGARRLG